MLPIRPRLHRRSLRQAALFGAALLLLPTTSASAYSLPMSGVWSGITALALEADLENSAAPLAMERAQPTPYDAITPHVDFQPIPIERYTPSEFALLEERSGGLGPEWNMNRRWSVGLTYRRGWENVQIDPTAERARGTLGGVPVDDSLATQSLMVEFRLSF